MLVCYLDDSGKDPQNPVTTIAGYVARDTEWEAFETEVERWFTDANVDVLHATDLQSGRGPFKGWRVLQKQAFIARICQTRNDHAIMGVSMAAQKATYHAFKAARGKRTASPYTFCFNVIIDWLLRDLRTGALAHSEGLAFVLEAGHENNAEAEIAFNEVRKHFGLEDTLRSISFVPKASSRAIQLADLFAFYSRRDHVRALKARDEGRSIYPTETMIRIVTEGLPHRGFVATTFGPTDSGSRFLRGDP